MKLSLLALNTLKHVLTTTGEREMGQDGKEQLAARRLNGEEAAQRRHFMSKVTPLLEEAGVRQNEIEKSYKEKTEKENKQKKDEKDNEYQARIAGIMGQNKEFQEAILEIVKEEKEIELTDKTEAVVKKYFEDYGATVGWGVGDDEIVEEITNVL
jgi:hypothetical protein